MKNLIFIFIGGGFGAATRFLCSKYINEISQSTFPWGTFTVNITGAFIIGVLTEFFDNSLLAPEMRLLLIVGYLGALTTFSSFSMESVNLLRGGELRLLALNIIVTNITGVAATIAGIYISRILINSFKGV